MSELGSKCWHNGRLVSPEEASPSIASISLHMGTGVFDGLMAYWNWDHYHLLEAKAHLARLSRGAERMGMPLRWSTEEMLAGIQSLLADEPRSDYYVRPIAYRGGPELWLTGAEGRPVDLSIFAVPVKRGNRTAIACDLSTVQRVSSLAMPVSWKVCGLYVNSFLARKEAEAKGFQDGLMLDRQGRVAEMSAANIFFLSHEGLETPALNEDVFPGITRGLVIDLARKQNIACVERDIYPKELSTFKGAFLCSTLMEMRPLARVGEALFNTEQLNAYQRLIVEFEALTSK